MAKTAYIVNPVSGNRRSPVLKTLEARFRGADPEETLLYATQSPGDAYASACRFLREGYTHLVAAGGDGTVNQVARALAQALEPSPGLAPLVPDPVAREKLRLGIIPVGSGNGFARHLHLPMQPAKALEIIETEKTLRVDLGHIDGRIFCCTAGVGFDASVGFRFNASDKRGLIRYATLTADEFTRYKTRKYRLSYHGRTVEREAYLITFANASQWGYNFYIAPEASLIDGMLDVVIWNKAPALAAPLFALELLAKTVQTDSNVEVIRCTSMRVEREAPDVAHYDGEIESLPGTLEVGVKKRLLPVFVP